jgi:phosphate transport system substrate-binding protein
MPRVRFELLLAWVAFAGLGCGGNGPRIHAGGSTFIDPLIQVWAGQYLKLTGQEIDYIRKGSGYGIQQMTERNIAFGCTEVPMTSAELERASGIGGEVIHLPLTIGAIAIIYSPGLTNEQQLKLSGPVLAEIFQRTITNWRDPRIVALNPTAELPDAEIVPVVRAEASGTTQMLTEYLNQSGESFPRELVSKKPKWPAGTVAQEGSDGVLSHVNLNRNCIGYVEVLHARRNHSLFAQLQNSAGQYTQPLATDVAAAAEQAWKRESQATLNPDLTLNLMNASGPSSYPIVALSYAVLYRKQPLRTGPTTVAFLRWALTDGQATATKWDFAPLPAELATRALTKLDTIQFE